MNTKRVRILNNKTYVKGCIVYWMSRDQRVEDNWALIYAQNFAKEYNTAFSVVFCLRKDFDFATERLVDFMLGGLQEIERTLYTKNISFYFLLGDPAEELPKFIKKEKVGALISDFSPLKYNRDWKEKISEKISIPFYEVDTHNIVPVWIASQKQEFGAYTLRPKIHRLLPEFLDEFSQVKRQHIKTSLPPIEWNKIYGDIKVDRSVKKVDWIIPGQKEAHKMLEEFIDTRLPIYSSDRNDPTKDAQSQLSPYIHFGHIATQRIALALGNIKGYTASKDAFLEELIVRKELSDNFCFYNKNYDNPKGFPTWAQQTLVQHKNDHRQNIYSLKELEDATTHDDLWNAAQKEMILNGKMHGYMRMYWAKKILEWSPNIELAQEHAMYLNDKYFLDGRDPNGYTGIAWAMGGVHDRAWFERPIFGKIRYMNYNGAKSKFDVDTYISMYL